MVKSIVNPRKQKYLALEPPSPQEKKQQYEAFVYKKIIVKRIFNLKMSRKYVKIRQTQNCYQITTATLEVNYLPQYANKIASELPYTR